MMWREIVAVAKKRGLFLPAERDRASSWGTCYVGEKHHAEPVLVRYREGRYPEDETLLALGDDGFYAAVIRHDFAAAERIMDAVDDRVLALKRAAGA